MSWSNITVQIVNKRSPSPLEPLTDLVSSSRADDGVRCGFLSCGAKRKSNQKVIGYATMLVPLFHKWTYLARSVIIAAHNVQSWVWLMVACIIACMIDGNLPALWKSPSRDEASRAVPAWFLHVLRLRYIMLPAIRSYYCALGDNQEKWQ